MRQYPCGEIRENAQLRNPQEVKNMRKFTLTWTDKDMNGNDCKAEGVVIAKLLSNVLKDLLKDENVRDITVVKCEEV